MNSIVRMAALGAATLCLSSGLFPARADGQEAGNAQVQIDPQTGRAVGAREMKPDELKALIAKKAKLIVIDVRDEAQFEKETIRGAIHIPLAELGSRLKEIPKDTTLAFT